MIHHFILCTFIAMKTSTHISKKFSK
nr:unnamed protein product [Callosobruchus chinensis]